MVYAGSSRNNGLWPYSLLVVSVFRSLDSLPALFLDGIQDSNKRIRNRNQIEIQPLESRASEIDFKGLASGHRPREARTEAVLIVSVKSEQLLREMHGTGRGPLRFIFSTPSVLEASITTHSWKLQKNCSQRSSACLKCRQRYSNKRVETKTAYGPQLHHPPTPRLLKSWNLSCANSLSKHRFHNLSCIWKAALQEIYWEVA